MAVCGTYPLHMAVAHCARSLAHCANSGPTVVSRKAPIVLSYPDCGRPYARCVKIDPSLTSNGSVYMYVVISYHVCVAAGAPKEDTISPHRRRDPHAGSELLC